MANTPIENESYQKLMVQLGAAAPIIGEKNLTPPEPIRLKQSDGTEMRLERFDVLRRADEVYWSSLAEDRHTLYDITDYQVWHMQKATWLTMDEWFKGNDL